MTSTILRPPVGNNRMRMMEGGWGRPHVHRPGPIDGLPPERVLDKLPSLPHWEPPKNAVRASQLRMRRRGAGHILEWLAGYPGQSWQERWFAAGGDDVSWI